MYINIVYYIVIPKNIVIALFLSHSNSSTLTPTNPHFSQFTPGCSQPTSPYGPSDNPAETYFSSTMQPSVPITISGSALITKSNNADISNSPKFQFLRVSFHITMSFVYLWILYIQIESSLIVIVIYCYIILD